jgi:hypothetical protein
MAVRAIAIQSRRAVMTRERALNNRWARVGLSVVATAVLAILAAGSAVLTPAPAFAEPAATSWTVTPTSKIITYGQAMLLSGTLKSGGAAIPGLWVDLGQATTASGSYEVIYKITTPTATDSKKYEVAVIPRESMYYRFGWPGDVTYGPSNSDVIPVQVMPVMGAPGNGTTISAGKKFSIKGSVTPGAPGGPAVKIKAYRQKAGGSWAGYKTYATTISGTQYSHSVAIAQTGKFKFKAVSVASAKYAVGASGYGKVLTVK